MQSNSWPSYIDHALLKKSNEGSSGEPQDLFIEKDGIQFAGTHLILDYWQASHLDKLDHVERALRNAVDVTGATLLHLHLHHFTPNGGISGVAVLAESHISIHTWPERNYAALDIFMCGDTEPEKAISVFEKAFHAGTVNVTKLLRGNVNSVNSVDKHTPEETTAANNNVLKTATGANI